MLWEEDVPKMSRISKVYKSMWNPLKILKEYIFGKVAGHQLITSKKVTILKCNVNYVIQDVLLFIFSLCSMYI